MEFELKSDVSSIRIELEILRSFKGTVLSKKEQTALDKLPKYKLEFEDDKEIVVK